jgi:hypothetical protein
MIYRVGDPIGGYKSNQQGEHVADYIIEVSQSMWKYSFQLVIKEFKDKPVRQK